MNKIVYVAAPGMHVSHEPVQATTKRKVGKWESVHRVTKERHAEAKKALREHYAMKAAALGMTLDGYCLRFGVKL